MDYRFFEKLELFFKTKALNQKKTTPAIPEMTINSIGLTLKKKTHTNDIAHIMMLMLFSPHPVSGKLALFIISTAAAKISPAMNGFMFFKVFVMMKLSLFLNKNLNTMYNNTKDGNAIENEANKEPNNPPI